MNSKHLIIALSCIVAFGLTACGDNVTEQIVNKIDNVGSVSSKGDLPECNEDKAGQTAFVKDDDAFYGCDGKKWRQLDGTTVSVGDNVCSSTALPDDEGFKIVCNGDSIGVVRNGVDGTDGKDGSNGKDGADGQDGEKGEKGDTGAKGDKGATGATGAKGEKGDAGDNGTGCKIITSSELTVTIGCGSETFTMDLTGYKPAEGDDDCDPTKSEDCAEAMENVELGGTSQKGPFVTGADVTAYELLNGRTLKQTGKTFGGKIENKDGSFNIKSVKLSSQYAYLVADGYYRNEVTGKNSSSAIKLRALTNLKGRQKANINLITHLEYDRVSYLVTKKGLSVANAKKQAENEIFAAFNIKSESFKGYAEDYNILEPGDGNAALLAISILLQANHTEAQLTSTLASISVNLGEKGEWNDSSDRARIADWAMVQDIEGKLATFRSNVEGWKLVDAKAPAFEQHFRNFWMNELKVTDCSIKNAGAIIAIHNPNSAFYAAKDSAYTEGDSTLTRFICAASGTEENATYAWRFATDLEKDIAALEKAPAQGAAKFGKINTGFVYVYENSAWRRGTELDITLSSSCVEKLLQQTIYSTSENSTDTTWYICVTNGNKQGNYVIPTSWRLATESEADTAQFGIPATTADSIKQGHINKAHYFVYEASKWRRGTDLDLLLEKICLASRKDSITKDDVGQYYTCTNEKKIQADGVTVYNTWRLSTANEADNYFTEAAVEGQVKQGDMDSTRIYVYENKAWRRGTSLDMQLSQEIDSEGNKINNGCIASKVGTVFKTAAKKYYTCTDDEIFENGVSIPTTWKLSTTSEADNYFVIDPQEGDARRGDMDTTLIYVYEGGKWRYGTELDLEKELGACTKNKKGTVLNKYDNYQITNGWFKCVESSDTYINNTLVPYTWKPASKVEYDTYGFETPTKDSARKGNYTSTIYVYDIIAKEWRIGTSLDTNSSLGPCTESNLENVGRVYNEKNKYYLYYQCLANNTLNSTTQPTSWQKSTYLKYDTWGLTCSKIGDRRKGRISTKTIYVCDSKIGPEWSELPSSVTDTLGFGKCNKTFMSKRCTAGFGCKGSWLTRKGEALSELQSNVIQDKNDSCVIDIGGGDTINIFYGYYPEVNDGYVTKGSINPNLKIIYDSLENQWSYVPPYTQAYYADSLGSACTKKLYTATYAENIYGEITYPQGEIRTTEKGNKYVCALAQSRTNEEYSKYAWTRPSQVRLETYGLGCDLQNKRKLYLNKYVCEADTFRAITKSESWAMSYSTERNSDEKNNIRCTQEDEGKTVKVDEVGTTFICKNKLYVWDQKPVITRESVKIRNSSAYDYWTEDEVVGLGIKKWTTSNVLIDTILAGVGIYQMDDRTEGIPSNFYVNKTIGSLICQSLGETKSMFRLPSKTEYQDLFTRFASDPKQLRAQSNGTPYPLIDWRPVGTNEFNFNLAPNGYLLADAEETTLPTTSLYKRTGTKESPIVTEVETMKIVGKDRAASFITYDGSVFVYDVVEGTSNKTTGYGAVRCVDTGSRAAPPLSN